MKENVNSLVKRKDNKRHFLLYLTSDWRSFSIPALTFFFIRPIERTNKIAVAICTISINIELGSDVIVKVVDENEKQHMCKVRALWYSSLI